MRLCSSSRWLPIASIYSTHPRLWPQYPPRRWASWPHSSLLNSNSNTLHHPLLQFQDTCRPAVLQRCPSRHLLWSLSSPGVSSLIFSILFSLLPVVAASTLFRSGHVAGSMFLHLQHQKQTILCLCHHHTTPFVSVPVPMFLSCTIDPRPHLTSPPIPHAPGLTTCLRDPFVDIMPTDICFILTPITSFLGRGLSAG